jgi:hypothetical protein
VTVKFSGLSSEKTYGTPERCVQGKEISVREHSAIRSVLLVTMPLVVLMSIALVTQKVGPEPDPLAPPKESPQTYAFTLLYAILHDDSHGPIPDRALYERRLAYLEKVIERESFGRITISPRLHFLSARRIGDDHLAYSNRSIYDWIPVLEAFYMGEGIPYDILVFCPASEAYGPWCTDGPSQGYSYHNRKYLCMETFLDHAKGEEDPQAVALTIHKILHGFGYNHISQENRPMSLLEWNMGLPKTKILPLAPREPGAPILFDKHIMKVLGFLPRNAFEQECLDSQGLTCVEEESYFCRNSYDIRCIDSDRDNIVDGEDDYLFTPYGSAGSADADSDGIPDHLDLCEGNRIFFDTNIRMRKTKGIVDRDRVVIRMEPASEVRGVNVYDAKNIGGFIGFMRNSVRRITGNELSLDRASLSAVTRLQIFYESPQGSFYKPFYLYREPQQIEYVHEREWYYFSRFGCDIPLGVDFSRIETYDSNLDGLPDKGRFRFADQLTDTYDWDGDGIPDVNDTLPTVHGDCRNRFVKGVPDSDGDGWCDPAFVSFVESVPGMLEGDLAISAREDMDADPCPYVRGTEKGGCP